MEEAFTRLGSSFAEKIIANDYEGAREFLAPWLRSSLSAEELRSMVERALGDLPSPGRFSLDGNSCGLADLEVDEYSPPTQPLSPEITEQNFRKWMCITFEPDPEEETGYDACFDLWMALVELDGKLQIGYLEPTDPDQRTASELHCHKLAPLYFARRQIIHVAPHPVLARLDRPHQRVLAIVEVLGGMLVLRGVATAHVAALQAQAQMHPSVAHFHALFANVLVSRGQLDLVRMLAGWHRKIVTAGASQRRQAPALREIQPECTLPSQIV